MGLHILAILRVVVALLAIGSCRDLARHFRKKGRKFFTRFFYGLLVYFLVASGTFLGTDLGLIDWALAPYLYAASEMLAGVSVIFLRLWASGVIGKDGD